MSVVFDGDIDVGEHARSCEFVEHGLPLAGVGNRLPRSDLGTNFVLHGGDRPARAFEVTDAQFRRQISDRVLSCIIKLGQQRDHTASISRNIEVDINVHLTRSEHEQQQCHDNPTHSHSRHAENLAVGHTPAGGRTAQPVCAACLYNLPSPQRLA